jgi:hypothetical protein
VYIIFQLGLSAFHSSCQRITRVDLGWTTVVRLTQTLGPQSSFPVLV